MLSLRKTADRTSWRACNRPRRTQDEAHVFHIEMFVVPDDGHTRTPEELDAIRRLITDLDWKLRDVVVTSTRTIPAGQVPPGA